LGVNETGNEVNKMKKYFSEESKMKYLSEREINHTKFSQMIIMN